MKLEFVELPFLQLGINGMIRTGAGFNSGDFTTEGVPLIKIGNIKNNLIDLNDCSFISENEKKINLTKEDDLLIAMRGATSGKLGIVSKEYANCFYVGSIGNLGKINDEIIYRPFIKYIEQQLYDILKTEAKGTATPMVSIGMLTKFKLIVPKTKEQQKYLFELLENRKLQVGELYTELSHQLSLVKKLRQQFLQDALQGKLVPQNKNDEPASELLKKIKAEKAKLIAEKKLKKEKDLPPIKPEEIHFEIPKNWVWCRLGEILTEIKYGTSQSCDYDYTKNSKILRIPNVSSGVLDGEDLKYTNLSEKEISELALEKDDILIIRSNGSRELVGRTVLVTPEFIGFAYAGYLVRFRFNKELTNARYFLTATTAPFFRELIEKPLRTTVGINNINTQEMSNLFLPLPPLSEQNRIVQKVEELMQYCNELEASIKESETQNEKLLQQLLREALRKEPVEA